MRYVPERTSWVSWGSLTMPAAAPLPMAATMLAPPPPLMTFRSLYGMSASAAALHSSMSGRLPTEVTATVFSRGSLTPRMPESALVTGEYGTPPGLVHPAGFPYEGGRAAADALQELDETWRSMRPFLPPGS